jgi:riboflavin synthase
MFTGIIQQVGILVKKESHRGGITLTIAYSPWSDPLHPGESIAVNGVCLSITSVNPQIFSCEMIPETITKTTLAEKKIQTLLNLERSLPANARLEGHIVLGHVDGIGVVTQILEHGSEKQLFIRCDPHLLSNVVEKGSIACDGVSLTVAKLTSTGFSVAITPFTWKNTAFRKLQTGDKVNIETDIIVKAIRKHLQDTGRSNIDIDFLQKTGFV